MLRPLASAVFLAVPVFFLPGQAWGWTDPAEPHFARTFNDFGTTGLLQMPNGRMAEDGTLAFGTSRTNPYRRFFLTLQGLPWLQGTFRYTAIEGRIYGAFSENAKRQSYKDKGIDVKVRLVEESADWPEISVGLLDVGGTGLFSSEYVAASRRYYDFDFTAGVGWGNMGSRAHASNPLGFAFDGMKSRAVGDTTGTILPNFFRGPIAVFGGIQWHTPLDGLRLSAEYDSSSYNQGGVGRLDDVSVRSPINVGASYRVFDWLDIAVGYERGNTMMARALLRTNLHTDHAIPAVDEKPPLPTAQPADLAEGYADSRGAGAGARLIDPLTDRVFSLAAEKNMTITAVQLNGDTAIIETANEGPVPRSQSSEVALGLARLMGTAAVQDVAVAYADGSVHVFATDQLLRRAALTGRAYSIEQKERDGAIFHACMDAALDSLDFELHRSSVEAHEAFIAYSQGSYRNQAKAAGRAARAMALCAPPDVLRLHVIELEAGLPVVHLVFLHRDVEGGAAGRISPAEAWGNTENLPAALPEGLDWRITDDLYPSTFWRLSPKLRQSIGGPDNFYFYQVFAEVGGGVRLTPGLTIGGNLGIDLANNLESLEYEAPSNLPRVRTLIKDYFKEAPVWLESLYASYSTQLAPDLYGNVTAGLFELMYGGVSSELFYRPTGARWAVSAEVNHVWQRDFQGRFGFRDYDITSGHLTWHHDLPWWNLGSAVSVGRYLAGDVGATLGISREFDNGTRVGLWATKTNVSAEEFGEGAFDKGFYVSIPLDVFSTKPNKSHMGFAYRPLTRDGGQRVLIPSQLEPTLGRGTSAITGWEDVWE